MATVERPKKTKKANKQAYRYESIAQQPEPNPDCGDCDHFGLKSPETSVLLLPSSTRDIDRYLGEYETPGLPGEKDLPPLSSEEPSEAVPSKRRTTLTAAIKRSFSGFTKNGPDTGADILENRNDNSNNERPQNKITEAESLENEEPLDVYAMFAKTTPLKTDEHAQSDEIKRIRTREQMVESLQSLRDVCLHTLDRLLSVLLSKASLSPNGYRLEDGTEGSTQAISTETDDSSSNEDLLRSIYFKSNRLANERSGPRGEGSHQTAVPDAELSPLTADNNEKYLLAIQERLDACSPSVPTDDYTLTSGLASLLNGVYHIMQDCDVPKGTKSANELAPSANSETSSTPPPVANSAAASSNLANSSDKVLYSSLRQRMDKVMGQRAASEGTLLTTRSDTPSSLWRETDRVMELVAGLLRDRSETSQKRAVSHTDMASLPSYGDIHSSGEHLTGDKQANSTGKKKSARLSLQPEDICNVLSAIDRVMEVVPRMNNQRVNLSDKQERAIAAASLSKAIVRLSKGRLEGQRADTSGRQQRLDALDHMLDRIAKSSTSQFNDQRVSLTDNQTKNLELAKITGVLDKASKKRMEKQEWQSSKQIKENDMNKLNRQLEDTMSLELETQQRYTLSAHKEKEMFMSNIMGKMNRLSDRRMNGQDAMSQLERKHERFQEIDTVMDRMTRGLDEQKFCKPPSALPAVSSSRATNHHRSLESLQPDVSIPPRTASPRTPNQLPR